MDDFVNIIRIKQDEWNIERFKNGRKEIFRQPYEIYDLNYKNKDNIYNNFDIYRPTNDFLPVIIEVHGGAYVSCSKETNLLHARYLASKGFAVININYTLQPEGNFIIEMQEIFEVLEWINNNKTIYKLDSNNVFITGDSAGGHLVFIASLITKNEFLQKYFKISKPKIEIKAVAMSCPVLDEAHLIHYSPTENKNDFINNVQIDAKGNLNQIEYFSNISLSTLVGKVIFPIMFILTTPYDNLLYKSVKENEERLNNYKVKHLYREYFPQVNKLEHVFNVLYPEYIESKKANNDIIEFFKKYITK